MSLMESNMLFQDNNSSTTSRVGSASHDGVQDTPLLKRGIHKHTWVEINHLVECLKECVFVRKDKKLNPGLGLRVRNRGIAKSRKFIKEMQALRFPSAKSSFPSCDHQSKWRQSSKGQHSKDAEEFEAISEDSQDVEGTTLLKCGIHKDTCVEITHLMECLEYISVLVRKDKKRVRYQGIAKERKFMKEMRILPFTLSKGFFISHYLKTKWRRSLKRRRLSKGQHSRDRKPSWEDEDFKATSEDSPDVEGTTLLKRGIHKDTWVEINHLMKCFKEDIGVLDRNDNKHVPVEINDLLEHLMVEICALVQKDKNQKPTCEDEEQFKELSEDSPVVEGTTWLKPVHYDDMNKDEQAIADLKRQEGKKRCDYFDLMIGAGAGVDFGKWPIRVGPVLQLMSVTIYNENGPTWKDLDIYGEISVPDMKNNVFYMFKRESNDPEWVSPELGVLDGCPMAPVMGGNVEFSLTNNVVNSGDVRIFKEHCYVGRRTGKTSTHVFNGIHGGYCAKMVFTKIPFAVIVQARMFLRYTPTDPSEDKKAFEVHGKIKVNEVVCFAKASEEAVKMLPRQEKAFVQSRDVFAVPAYSPYVVEVSLYNGRHRFANERHELYPLSWRAPLEERTVEFACKDKRYRFVMDVRYILHDQFFHGIQWQYRVNAKRSPDDVLPDDFLLTDRQSRESQTPPAALVEVFSVYVGCGDSSSKKPPPALCGTIVVRDKIKSEYIFSRDCGLPDKLSYKKMYGRTVSLAWPADRWVHLDRDFCMRLKLKDVHSNNRVCWGVIAPWRTRPYDNRLCDAVFDRRICDLIEGENGYFAAVHYSVFKNGKKAKVSVKWEGPYNSVAVYGSVVAEYSNYDYPSTYDKEYYRSIIFNRSWKDRVRVKKDSEIPLSKSHVSAPSDCKGLDVYVNLLYCPFTDSFDQYAIRSNKLEFKAAVGKKTQVKNHRGVEVKVEWSS